MEIDALHPSTSLRAASPPNRCDVIGQRRKQFTGQNAGGHQGRPSIGVAEAGEAK